MPSVYVVHMWLTCNSTSPSALNEFAKRFPASLQATWANLVYPDTVEDLKKKLDDEIQLQCQSHIEADFFAQIQSVDTFQSDIWTEGGGTGHEGHSLVYALPADAEDPSEKRRWNFTFPGGGSTRVDISAHAEWALTEIQ